MELDVLFADAPSAKRATGLVDLRIAPSRAPCTGAKVMV